MTTDQTASKWWETICDYSPNVVHRLRSEADIARWERDIADMLGGTVRGADIIAAVKFAVKHAELPDPITPSGIVSCIRRQRHAEQERQHNQSFTSQRRGAMEEIARREGASIIRAWVQENAPSAKDIGSGYVALKMGDVLQAGDEVWDWPTERWEPIKAAGSRIEHVYRTAPIRRKVSDIEAAR